ncbi:hypothetical protein M0Q97_02165, partial [Candidatus Dojkabacteria bacterium]|nr:hypothetical protein [Candidatus Dojkabacteria bacterium]
KLSKELKNLRTLEDREQQIEMKLQDVNESLTMLAENKDLVDNDKDMQRTQSNMLVYKHKLVLELNEIKAKKSDTRKYLLR